MPPHWLAVFSRLWGNVRAVVDVDAPAVEELQERLTAQRLPIVADTPLHYDPGASELGQIVFQLLIGGTTDLIAEAVMDQSRGAHMDLASVTQAMMFMDIEAPGRILDPGEYVPEGGQLARG